MKAVIWTELVQASVYIVGGISATVLIGNSVAGGWTQIFSQANAANKLQVIDLYTGFDKPYTLCAGLIGGAFLAMASARGRSTHRATTAFKSFTERRTARINWQRLHRVRAIHTLPDYWHWSVGAVREPHIPAGRSDFPTYIVERMPHGLIGLIVAAIVAATMSTHSGAINSLAATTTHDIYLPLSGRSADDPRTLQIGKYIALLWGLVLTGGALLFKQQGTPVVVVALAIASFTYGGLLGGFFLGIFWKRAIQRDAILGMSVGIFVMAFIVFAKQIIAAFPQTAGTLSGVATIAFPWYVLIGLTITMTTGILSSFTHSDMSSQLSAQNIAKVRA